MKPVHSKMIGNMCLFERMEAAINQFQSIKALGPDGLYSVLLQKGWNQLKRYYHVNFEACLRHSYVPSAWKEGTGYFSPNPESKAILKLNPSP